MRPVRRDLTWSIVAGGGERWKRDERRLRLRRAPYYHETGETARQTAEAEAAEPKALSNASGQAVPWNAEQVLLRIRLPLLHVQPRTAQTVSQLLRCVAESKH